MIDPTPRWAYASRQDLTQWYGHVHLLPGHALGQWFCVDRANGKRLWERAMTSPNSVSGVVGDVVVATETNSSGPGTWTERCFGLSLATGETLWSSHGDDGRDSPSVVHDVEVLCGSGRVLDARTGRLLRRLSRDEVRAGVRRRFKRPKSDPKALYWTRMNGIEKGARLEGIGWLTHRAKPGESGRDGFRLYAVDDAGEVAWAFDLATTGYVINHCNYYAYRLAGRHVYVVAAEGPNSRPASAPIYREPVPTTFHLLTVEVERGTVVQSTRLTSQPVTECRIEDVDAAAVLVSIGRRELKYYARAV